MIAISGRDSYMNSLGCSLEHVANLCISRVPGKAFRVSGKTSNSEMGFYVIQLQMGIFGCCAMLAACMGGCCARDPSAPLALVLS